MSAMKNDNGLMIGAVLIVGALIYSKQSQARTVSTGTRGVTTMPGSVGTGSNQSGLSGIIGSIGSMVSGLFTSSSGTGSFSQSVWNPFNPNTGQSYDPANPGAYIPLQELANGTVTDYYKGANAPVASVSDIIAGESGSSNWGSPLQNFTWALGG